MTNTNRKRNAKMTRVVMGCVLAGLLTAATAGIPWMTARAQEQPPPAAGVVKSLEGLLTEVGIDSTRSQEALFKTPLEVEGEATPIAAREATGYKDSGAGQEAKVVVLRSRVAMLQRMSQFNDDMLIGNVALGDRSIGCVSTKCG